MQYMISDRDSLRALLRQELLDQFVTEGLRIIAAHEMKGFQRPPALKNDGYGDQKSKRPDAIAFHPSKKYYVIGIVRTGDGDIESEESLTEYNVFLDQKDKATQEPFRLWIIAPQRAVDEVTTLMTRYIHPDYWNRITMVRSSRC